MKRALTVCALILATTTLSVFDAANAAEVVYYRWKDGEGRPVHSDRPPPKGIDYEVISTGSSFIRPVDSDEGVVPLDIEPTPGNNFKPVDTAKPKPVKNPEYCARAQENLETLNTRARIRMRNEQGELAYIDDTERKIQRKQAEDNIKAHCD